jgi:carbonic anhydrase
VTLGHEENASTLWTLVQFHFHDGSEHTIDGNRFDTELHLVHQSTEGKIMVIGILMNGNGNGDDNVDDSYDVSETLEPLLQAYEAAAANVGDACNHSSVVEEDANVVTHEALGISDVPDGWSPYDVLPDADAFTVGSFAYMGSLTTPPCTTGVKWLVLDTPMSISAEQNSRLKDLIGSLASPSWPSCSSEIPVDYYGTYRPTQSAGFRNVVHFCDV